MAVAGILLTGGASSRIGVDKALIEVGGRRLVDLAAEKLQAATAEAVEVGPGYSALRSVREEPPGSGPLAGFAAGAAALAGAGCDLPILLLAVDMPLVGEALLALLASQADQAAAVIPVAGARVQPLCAVYPAAAGRVARELLAQGHGSMRALLDAIPLRSLDEDAWRGVAAAEDFSDIDTPAALHAIRHRLEHAAAT